jgi:hypothetical protein
MQRVFYTKTGDVLVGVLLRDLVGSSIPVLNVGFSSPLVQVDYDDNATSFQMTQGEIIVAAHVPIDPWAVVSNGAEAAAAAIPSWAHWSEDDAQTWWEDNIHTPLVDGRANLPTTLTLATTRLVFIALLDILDKMAAMLWAMARMMIALRNREWPNLQN